MKDNELQLKEIICTRKYHNELKNGIEINQFKDKPMTYQLG